MEITKEMHEAIQTAINDFGEELKSVRESLAFAAPEMQDYHWQRVSEAGVWLVQDVISILNPEAKEARP